MLKNKRIFINNGYKHLVCPFLNYKEEYNYFKIYFYEDKKDV